MAELPAEIASMRAAVDEVDHALLELCARRRALVASLLAAKRELGLALLDPGREDVLLAERRAFAEGVGVPADLAETLFRALLEGSHAEINKL